MKGSGWLTGLPPEVAARVRDHCFVKMNGARVPTGRWSVVIKPTTLAAREVDLVRRDGGGSIVFREPVMRGGVAVGAWAEDAA